VVDPVIRAEWIVVNLADTGDFDRDKLSKRGSSFLYSLQDQLLVSGLADFPFLEVKFIRALKFHNASSPTEAYPVGNATIKFTYQCNLNFFREKISPEIGADDLVLVSPINKTGPRHTGTLVKSTFGVAYPCVSCDRYFVSLSHEVFLPPARWLPGTLVIPNLNLLYFLLNRLLQS